MHEPASKKLAPRGQCLLVRAHGAVVLLLDRGGWEAGPGILCADAHVTQHAGLQALDMHEPDLGEGPYLSAPEPSNAWRKKSKRIAFLPSPR